MPAQLDERLEWRVDAPDEITQRRVAGPSRSTPPKSMATADEGVEGEHTEKRKGNRSRDRALRVSNLFAERGDPGVSGKGEEEKAGRLERAEQTSSGPDVVTAPAGRGR